MSRSSLLAAAMVAASLLGCASEKPDSPFETAFNDDTKTWKEIETEFPAPPAAADLLEFKVSGATSYRFYLDTKALSIGPDGVYRFTLVAVSPSGARNVSYEGVRCASVELGGQKRLYAFGRPDGTWSRSRNSAWTPIQEVGNNRQEAALAKEIFCPGDINATKKEQILRRLKPGIEPSEADYDRRVRGYDQ
jgi:CNP1-like family